MVLNLLPTIDWCGGESLPPPFPQTQYCEIFLGHCMKQFVVFGQLEDPHVETVIKSMPDYIDPIVINYYDMPEIVLGNFESYFTVNNNQIDFDAPTIIWNRYKSCFNPNWENPVDGDQAKRYWKSQWLDLMQGIETLFKNAVKFNSVAALSLSENKIFQTSIAIKVGFELPKTVITNSLMGIKKNIGDQVLFKPLNGTQYETGKHAYATRINLISDNVHSEELRVAPGIFQIYEDKSYELRVVSLNGNNHAIKINSQDNELTATDWRKAQLLNMYEPYQIPDSISEMLNLYLNMAGLKYGVFDFIVNDDKKYIFLECNPDGQWLYYSDASKLNVESDFASMLIDAYDSL